MKALEMPRGQPLLEIISVAAKPKLILVALSHLPLIALTAVWLLAAGAAYRAAELLIQSNEPTLPEVNQHLLYNDKRIDALHDDIAERLDRLEKDRDSRREASDARYKDMSDRLRAMEHDDAYIWGGAAICAGLLGLNILRVNRNERRSKEYPIRLHRTGDTDLEQNEMLADFVKSMVAQERERKRKEDR